MYYTSPSVTMDELEEHELDTWRSKYLSLNVNIFVILYKLRVNVLLFQKY